MQARCSAVRTVHTSRCPAVPKVFFFSWRYNPHWGLYFTALLWALASSLARFLDHTQRRTTVGRTSLNEWSVRRRDLYLTTHNTHNRQISMPPVGFEPTISAGQRPKTYALDRAATSPKSYTCKCKSKAVPLQAWSGPEGSRKLRFPDFMTTAQDGDKVVSLTYRPPLPPENTPGTHFC